MIPRSPSRARTAPPGPAPQPARPRPSAGGAPGHAAGTARVPEIPAGAAALSGSPRPPAPMTSHGIDFSLPVTATSPGMPAVASSEPPRSHAPPSGGIDFSLPATAGAGLPANASGAASRESPRPRAPGSGDIDFSLPVTAAGSGIRAEASGASSRESPRPGSPGSGGLDISLPVTAAGSGIRAEASGESPRSRAPASEGIDFALPVTATSASGAREPEPEPEPLPAPPVAITSAFAEPSRVGPGHNAAPPGGADVNTAWPPRPIPVDASAPPSRRASPDVALPPPGLLVPEPDGSAGADRLKVALTRRRMWWIGGGLAGVSIAVIVAAALSPNPAAVPADGDGRQAQAQRPAQAERSPEQLPGQPPGRAPGRSTDRVEPAAPRDVGRPGRETAPAAAGAAAAPDSAIAATSRAALERRSVRTASAPPDTSMRIRSADLAGRSAAATGAPHAGHAAKRPRKLVVDYTARPNETPPPSLVVQTAEDPAIGQARGAYTTGNQRLFVGDLDGAVRAYREALELYPGYVGGYRGLGLAYEELGDTASALAAFRAYVAAVPTARDIALIKKRIAHLQRR